MSGRDRMVDEAAARPLLEQAALVTGIVIGELVGITNEGGTPLVLYPGQPGSAAIGARTVIDLHGPHIGSHVVLMFDGGDAARPVVMGVLRERAGWSLAPLPGHVEADVDGERLIVSARDELVLRCGKASITLTRRGDVVIRGSHVLTRSTGTVRVWGGAVHLN